MRFLCGDMSEGPNTSRPRQTIQCSCFPSYCGNERFPVKIFKEFARRRPLGTNKPDSPFTSQSDTSKNQVTTYGICEVYLRKMKSANFSLSLRKTLVYSCISLLLDADVPDNFVAQLSGHRSLKSLYAYKSASYEHQRRMSLALSRSNSKRPASTSTRTETTTRPTPSVTSAESVTFNPVQMVWWPMRAIGKSRQMTVHS